MENLCITIVERPDAELHRSKVIVHRGLCFYLAEFHTVKQLNDFIDFAGITITLEKTEKCEMQKWKKLGTYETYSISHTLDDNNLFWNISEVPEGAKMFKALSNGSIVDCYLLNDGETIHIYRPNPNAKEVYKPLPLDEHIKWHKEHGII